MVESGNSDSVKTQSQSHVERTDAQVKSAAAQAGTGQEACSNASHQAEINAYAPLH